MNIELYNTDCVTGMAERLAPDSVDLVVTCPTCGQAYAPKRWNQRFCSAKCKWTRNNEQRGPLPPNVQYDCVICGKHVAKYVPPADWHKHAFLYCSRRCKGKGMSGAAHPMWSGGRVICDQGYVHIFQPDHPGATKRGYVREHRLVMERLIGRYLRPEEVVHHDDDNGQNNDPANLRLFANNAEHKAYEMRERKRDEMGRLVSIGGVA